MTIDPSQLITIGQGALGVLDFVKSKVSSDIIAGHFKWDGTLIHGSEKILLKKQNEEGDPSKWWYYVEGLDDYTFMRFPVVESAAFELTASINNEPNNDARYWRWVPLPKPNTILGGNSSFNNIKVDFIVLGYKPKALIDYFQS